MAVDLRSWPRWVWLVAAVGVSAASSARAQPAEAAATGTVIRVDGGELFVDVGSARVAPGVVLEVVRTIEVRHPVTRRTIRDRFVIARAIVQRVGTAMAVARVQGQPWRTVEVGDGVELPPPAGAAPSPGPAAPTPSSPPAPTVAAPAQAPSPPPTAVPTGAQPALDPATAELLVVFRAALGRVPEERIRLFVIYLRRNPTSPHRAAIEAEIAALQALLVTLRQPRSPAPPAPVDAGEPQREIRAGVAARLLRRAREAQPVDLAVVIAPGLRLGGLLFHARRGEGGSYPFTRRMRIHASGYARLRLPASLVTAPGFSYFVEATAPDGLSVPVLGTATHPVRVVVEPLPSSDAEQARSRVRVSSELVDFDRFRGRDWYFQAEADFLYRVRFHQLHGIRVGYGAIRGRGDSVANLDADPGSDGLAAGFTYGYVEAELRLAEIFAIAARVSVGLGRPERIADGLYAQRDGLRGGFQLRARIGKERGTHLLIGGEALPQLGERAVLGLHWETIRRLPMTAEVQVTNQPVGEDLAVRLIYELGYDVTDWFAFSARLSYQGRNLDHTGGGLGLAATFDW